MPLNLESETITSFRVVAPILLTNTFTISPVFISEKESLLPFVSVIKDS